MKYKFDQLFATGGGIKKYQSGGGVSYDFGNFLDSFASNTFSRAADANSIAYSPDWKDMSGKYANVKELENDPKYQAFTKYVLEKAQGENADPRVLQYLRNLEKYSTNPGHNSILFDDQNNLVSNWQDLYTKLRNDGKYGYYHLGPEGQEASTPEPEPKPQPEPEEPKPPLEFDSPKKPEHTPWTDWMPLTAQYANDMINHQRQYQYAIKKKFPLQEAPTLQHKVTNDYALRSSENANINDMQARAEEQANNASDLRAGMHHQQNVALQATQLRNQMAEQKAAKFNEESSRAEQVANTNKAQWAATANHNANVNAAAMNNILAAKSQLQLNNLNSKNSYIANMTASHGEWLKDARINDIGYQKALNLQNFNKAKDALYDDYMKMEDYTNSEAWKKFRQSEFAGANGPADANDDDWYKNEWENGGDNAKDFISQYEKEKNDAYKKYTQLYKNAYYKYLEDESLIPTTVSNQGFYRNPFKSTVSTLFTKKGGRLARFIDYMNHIQKEQQSVRKETMRTVENAQKSLNNALNRINQQELILLRSVFK